MATKCTRYDLSRQLNNVFADGRSAKFLRCIKFPFTSIKTFTKCHSNKRPVHLKTP